ncbi:MAG: pyrroline-5-carboxylate reductase [Nitrospinae bacterium]|nr:pyrroline-5-carboxylate reductase [Nitrospinota bacterium]
MIKSKTTAFIGAGFMGSALIRGLARSGLIDPSRIIATDPREGALKEIAADLGVRATMDNALAVSEADIVVICVKPQILSGVLKTLGRKISRKKLVISIAAGVKMETLQSLLPSGSRIIRAMPNMPSAVGQGATAICAGGDAEEMDVAMARQIFDAVGETVVVDEKQMDAVTGLSGSGPAFVFLFLEAFIDAGVRVGLPRDVARVLALQTLYGSAKFAKSTGEHPAALKDRVTSPGGTTIAGLAVLEEEAVRGALIRAVEAATERSKELGGQ